MQLRSEICDSSALASMPATSGSADAVRRVRRQRRLDAKRRKRVVENDRYREMLSRLLRGMERRVSDGDPEDLALLSSLALEVNALLTQAVKRQHEAHEVSWSRIADVLGVTKQAAQQRFKSR